MKFADEFRDAEMVREIARRIEELSGSPARIMEVCGTHTMSAARFGLKSLLPEDVKLVSGPGCPVCVTDQTDIDAFLALGSDSRNVLASFGDMLRVPGTETSLEKLRAEGADVRIVYSPLDAVDLAEKHVDRNVVFFGVGFETTMPTVAVALLAARERNLGNFSVLCVHKTMPSALRALLESGEMAVAGLLCPGHVTTIIGAQAYEFIPREFGIPCAVTGFEPVDMMLGIEAILRQISEDRARVDNVYTRAVRENANPRAKELLDKVFEPCDARWRGLGVIPGSGVRIREEYADLDASKRFAEAFENLPAVHRTPCRCGDVLRGAIEPLDCAQFGTACTPLQPLGPCMVSSEGACAAAYRYGGTLTDG